MFEVNKDTVIIKYSILKYDHGKSKLEQGQDKAIIMTDHIVISR